MATDDHLPATPRFDAHLQGFLRATAQRPAPRRMLVVAAGVAVAALALVLVNPVLDGGPSGRVMAGGVLPDGNPLPLEELDNVADVGELRRRLEEHGITLDVEEVPVAPAAVGRIFGWSLDHDADPPAVITRIGERAQLTAGDVIRVTVGRPARDGEQVTTEGLTYFEAYPQLCGAVIPSDPAATGSTLADLGFQVDWLLVEYDPAPETLLDAAPTAREVDAPPPGTVVSRVGRPDGELLLTPAPADRVQIQLTQPDEGRGALELPQECGQP